MQQETIGHDLNDVVFFGLRQRSFKHRLMHLWVKLFANLWPDSLNSMFFEHVQQFAQRQFNAFKHGCVLGPLFVGRRIQRPVQVVIDRQQVARQTAAAARKCGLACEILLENRTESTDRDYLESGNVFLDRLFGAAVTSSARQREAQSPPTQLAAISIPSRTARRADARASPADVEAADALGAVHLVARPREQVDVVLLDIRRHLADPLRGVSVEDDVALLAQRADLGDLGDNFFDLADEGDLLREDVGCGILYAVLRDSAYKIKKLAEAERTVVVAVLGDALGRVARVVDQDFLRHEVFHFLQYGCDVGTDSQVHALCSSC